MNEEKAKELYNQYLVKNKMFYTKERATILDTILQRDDHFSVDELIFDMQKDDVKISRATLYRSLSQLAEAGILEEADFGHGHMHYELASDGDPHYHLICTECQAVEEVESRDLIEAVDSMCKKKKFKPTRHKLQIFGLCKTCK